MIPDLVKHDGTSVMSTEVDHIEGTATFTINNIDLFQGAYTASLDKVHQYADSALASIDSHSIINTMHLYGKDPKHDLIIKFTDHDASKVEQPVYLSFAHSASPVEVLVDTQSFISVLRNLALV